MRISTREAYLGKREIPPRVSKWIHIEPVPDRTWPLEIQDILQVKPDGRVLLRGINGRLTGDNSRIFVTYHDTDISPTALDTEKYVQIEGNVIVKHVWFGIGDVSPEDQRKALDFVDGLSIDYVQQQGEVVAEMRDLI